MKWRASQPWNSTWWKIIPTILPSPKFQRAYSGSNLSPSPRHISRRYFQQPWKLWHHHQREAHDVHSSSNQQTNPHGTPPPIPCYISKHTKSQEIFNPNSPNHIIRVGYTELRLALCSATNCQNFGHVQTNWKQPSRCFWCGGDHLHKDWPEKTNTESMPSCCDCTLGEEKPHQAPYRDCSHWKGEEHKLPRNPLEGCSLSMFTSPEQSYAGSLCQDTQH
jgi:hypothetical protein